jgi:A/G-specific adenine glycosylase
VKPGRSSRKGPLSEGKALKLWFEKEGRNLPWRREGISPWEVLVSEFLLQQTRVETILPRYQEIVRSLSSPHRCARIEERELLYLWRGLGYYRRALNLKETARRIVELYGGSVPNELDELRKLPGVGEYTARAILVFAFHQRVPVMDGNIRRVFARRFALKKTQDHPDLFVRWFNDLYREGKPRTIVSALMDLGAQVCLPHSPRCTLCPIHPFCEGSARGDPEQYPEKIPSRTRPQESWIHLWITRGSFFLFIRRPPGLLGNHLTPPATPGTDPPLSLSIGGGTAHLLRTAPPYQHPFTHKIWFVTPAHYELTLDGENSSEGELIPIPRELLDRTPLPRAFLKGGKSLFPEIFTR